MASSSAPPAPLSSATRAHLVAFAQAVSSEGGGALSGALSLR